MIYATPWNLDTKRAKRHGGIRHGVFYKAIFSVICVLHKRKHMIRNCTYWLLLSTKPRRTSKQHTYGDYWLSCFQAAPYRSQKSHMKLNRFKLFCALFNWKCHWYYYRIVGNNAALLAQNHASTRWTCYALRKLGFRKTKTLFENCKRVLDRQAIRNTVRHKLTCVVIPPWCLDTSSWRFELLNFGRRLFLNDLYTYFKYIYPPI